MSPVCPPRRRKRTSEPGRAPIRWLNGVFFLFFLLILIAPGATFGSILDLADLVIDESEPNPLNSPQDLPFGGVEDILALGIRGDLADSNDVDAFGFSVAANGNITLKLDIDGLSDQDITALSAGGGGRAFFAADNNIWRRDPNGAILLVSAAELAEALGLADLTVSDIAAGADSESLDLFVTLSGRGDILKVDSEGEVSLYVAQDEVTEPNLTGQDSADLVNIAVDGDGVVYAADAVSGSVLQVSDIGPGAVEVFASGEAIYQSIKAALIDSDILAQIIPVPSTPLAVAPEEKSFNINSLIVGDGVYGQEGYDVYYATQLGNAFQGDGTITRVSINKSDPNDVEFTDFYKWIPTQQGWFLNPSALAIDTSGVFGNNMFLGSFGDSLGDDFDAQVFVVDAQGEITDFVTAYVDMDGQPVVMDGNEVDGFFDVTDMAFSPGGEYGQYLYILSENANLDEPGMGKYASDLWRIDPDGVAELFIRDVVSAAISLAFDTTSNYGNYLYVATFHQGKIVRVGSDGSVETFIDIEAIYPKTGISDIAFSPADSVMAGAMIMSLTSGGKFLTEVEPDGQTIHTWCSNMYPGDISGGDILFDESGNPVIAQGGLSRIRRLDIQDLFDYSFVDLQIRRETTQNAGVVDYDLYALTDSADYPRLMRIGGSEPNDIRTAVNPALLAAKDDDGQDSSDVAFTFDEAGDMYVYIQNLDELQTSPKGEQGHFADFQTVSIGAYITEITGLIDPRITHLAWSDDGSILALGRDSNEAAEGDAPPGDNMVLKLGSAAGSIFVEDVENLVQLTDLTVMQLTLSGPAGFNQVYQATSGTVLEPPKMAGLDEGSYLAVIESLLNSSGDYEMLVSLGGDLQRTIQVNQAQGPEVMINTAGDHLALSCEGPGQVELLVNQRPNGTVVDGASLTISQSKSNTKIRLVNMGSIDSYENWIRGRAKTDYDSFPVNEVRLDGSLKELVICGPIETISASTDSKGTVAHCSLGHVGNIETPDYRFGNFAASGIGVRVGAGSVFNAQSIRSIEVEDSVENITVMHSGSRNYYRNIKVGGVIIFSTFYGRGIGSLQVDNNQNEDAAILSSTFDLTSSGGILKSVMVTDGDVFNSNFDVEKQIGCFTIANGDLDQSNIRVFNSKGMISDVSVERSEQTDENEGNIRGSLISAGKMIKRVRADGVINTNSEISTPALMSSKIRQVSCGGDFSGKINSPRIHEVLVGFDSRGKRLAESAEAGYSGSDFSGTITTAWHLRTLCVTGAIRDATISARVYAGYGNIGSIFAEDGFEHTTVSVGAKITRIMVGYQGGRRTNIANADADVSGTINANRLGRLYYTGTKDLDLSQVRHIGPVVGDNQ